MKVLAAAAVVCLSCPALAQQLELPKPSLAAKVSQTAGLTEISLDYSSPAARGRQVFGGIVPFGEVWRTGANSCTKISFSKDVQIGDSAVPAGTYCLFTIPRKDRWTFIVNKDAAQWGAYSYKDALDVARAEVTPVTLPSARERLAFIFSDASDGGVKLDLEWERTRASLPIKLFTDKQAAAAIQSYERGGWRPWNSAALWELQKKDYAAGLRLVETSLRLNETPQNLWTKAQLLAGSGQIREAHAAAQKALDLGKKEPGFEGAPEIAAALSRWR